MERLINPGIPPSTKTTSSSWFARLLAILCCFEKLRIRQIGIYVARAFRAECPRIGLDGPSQ